MKYIKNRDKFLAESKGEMSDGALHTLATHDDGQSPDVQKSLDALDTITPSGKVVTRFAQQDFYTSVEFVLPFTTICLLKNTVVYFMFVLKILTKKDLLVMLKSISKIL